MKTLLFLVGAIVLFASRSIHAAEAACPSITERVLLQVAVITLDEDARTKIRDLETLIRTTAAMNPAEIESVDQRAILLLTPLLKEPDNGVRMYVAAALAEFGYRAEPALPALELAYRETVDKPISADIPLLPSTSAHAEIGDAIERIRQKSVEHAKLVLNKDE